jgi:ATP-dependent DNA helicase RecG
MINFGHETEELEFKKSTSELHDAMKDIVAILNKHESGTLYFGVAPNGDVKGQQVTESTLRDISRIIYESIKPQIYPQIQQITIDGCDIIEVKFSGKNKPYSAYGKYYTRVADECKELTPSELKEMMLVGEYSERWEQFETQYTIQDIDEAALKAFYDRATACGRLPDDGYDTKKLLSKLGLIKDGKLNNAGYVLFGNNGPVTLKMAVFATDEKLTFLDINRTEDNIFKLVDIALTYIKKNIRWRVEIGGLTREEIPEIPVKALREIVINSFAHAQYGTATQHEIDIHPGKVVIYNPGEFPPQFSPEDFANKNLSSIIRNELIAKVLYLCHDIESFGSGFKRVYTLCNQADTNCTYEKSPIGFSFIFLRKDINAQTIQSEKTDNNRTTTVLSKNEKAIYDLLKAQPSLTKEELSIELGKTTRTIQRVLDKLKEKGLITRIGTNRTGYWEVK